MRRAQALRQLSLPAWVGCLLLFACQGAPLRSRPAPVEAEPGGLSVAEAMVFTPEDELSPSVSRDGLRVLYASQLNGNLDVWIRDFETNSSYPVTLHPADDFDPRIGPKAGQWAFASRRFDAKGDIFLAEGFASGAERTRLTGTESGDRQPVFSPDGRRVYFTTELGLGYEHIAVVELEDKSRRRVSPGPGFDPEVSPGGGYLVYTARPSPSTGSHPRLVALRLADSSTVAITSGSAPEGFARFVPAEGDAGRLQLVYVRFIEDDNGDGHVDARDHASLWSTELDLAALFSKAPGAVGRPQPLTDGVGEQLFPDVNSGELYFTEGAAQQDIMRLPLSGVLPAGEGPQALTELGRTLEAPAQKRLAYRAAAARAPLGGARWAEAETALGQLYLREGRSDLAEGVFSGVVARCQAQPMASLAEAERVALSWRREVAAALTPQAAERARFGARLKLERLQRRHAGSALAARVQLELAELTQAGGDRAAAIEALARVSERAASEPQVAAAAALRRIELLGIAHNPDALAEAYARVLDRFPQQQELVREAAQRIVSTHLDELGAEGRPGVQVDLLRRVLPRYRAQAVRAELRWRLAMLLKAQGHDKEAAQELSSLLAEPGVDRLRRARALRARAGLNEALDRLGPAAEDWTQLRAEFSDLPGYGAEARAAITRVSLRAAVKEEQAGDPNAALAAYARVVDNDPDQVKAWRRLFQLAVQTGQLRRLSSQAQTRAEAAPGTPMARYAYGLALSWQSPPALDDALTEVEAALKLNPQLVAAYITRGWILEMQELKATEDPGWFTAFYRGVGDVARSALGGLLDVEIGKSGLLERAVDDYKTALHLNPEATDPETEAEILINLGNAHYRLAQATSDLANMLIAFRRYAESLRFGYRFRDPATELVFWERFGRSASWMGEYGLSAMASRRALALAPQVRLQDRGPQILGNLAVAYNMAGEEIYAQRIQERLQQQAEDTDERARAVLTLRERARARLATEKVQQRQGVLPVLSDLKQARDKLKAVETLQAGEVPMWVPAVPDSTQAQYGFRKGAELDVNLALSEAAYRLLGQERLARALSEERRALTKRVIDEVPGVPATMWVMPREPLTLVQQRERLGLFLAAARDKIRLGDGPAAQALFQQIGHELEEWTTLATLSQPDLLMERARWRTAWLEFALSELGRRTLAGTVQPSAAWADAELQLSLSLVAVAKLLPRPKLSPALEARWQEEVERLQIIETSTIVAKAGAPLSLVGEPLELELAALPQTLSSTTALAATSAAAEQPRLAAVDGVARGLQARLSYLRGVVALSPDQTSAQGTKLSSLSSLLSRLDSPRGRLDQAEAHFSTAARAAAGAGPRASRVLGLSLAGLARVATERGDPQAGLRWEAAERAMKRDGDLEGLWVLRLSKAMSSGRPAEAYAALSGALPTELNAAWPLVEAAVVHTASIAIAAGEPAKALSAYDRLLGWDGARRRVPTLSHAVAADRAGSLSLRKAQLALAAARAELAASDVSTEPALLSRRVDEVARRVAALEDLQSKLQKQLSPIARAAVFGQGPDPEGLLFDLAEDEAALLFAPRFGELVIFLLDGASEEGEVELFKTGQSFSAVRADLAQLRAQLAKDTAPAPALLARLRAALFGPLRARLLNKRRLVLAPALLGAPIPWGVFSGQASLTQLRAPSSLSLVRAARRVGSQGSLTVGRGLSYPGSAALSAAEALAFSRPIAPPEPGEARDLKARSPAELLPQAQQAALLLSAPLHLEPAAPGDSTLSFAAPPVEGAEEAPAPSAADAFSTRLPLSALAIPARLSVFGEVRGAEDPARAASALSLDLPLAMAGQPTALLIPEALPKSAAQALVDGLQERAAEAPGQALSQLVRAGAAAHPSLQLVSMIGSAGLSAEEEFAYAKDGLPGAKRAVQAALKAKDYPAAVRALSRWIRFMKVAKQGRRLPAAYAALVGILQDKLRPPRYARACDMQAELIEVLKQAKARPEQIGDKLVDLGYLYSLAGDEPQAEATFKAAFAQLKPFAASLARADFKYGQHLRHMHRYQAAAQALERSIKRYDALGAYKAKKRPVAAVQAVLLVGVLYLNQLSDPEAAKAAYERALGYARTDSGKVGLRIDLARVARRRGDFSRATAEIQAAREGAKSYDLPDLQLSAEIEAANIAWYQGDYQLGQTLCERSLSLGLKLSKQLVAAMKKKKRLPRLNPGTLARRRVYALSVCGVVAMSQRDRAAAVSYLQRAKKLAARLGAEQEVATQHNNLGRALLEFGELEPAIGQFQAAEAIDRRLKDRYALAYDYRNLGQALLYKGLYPEAGDTFQKALKYAEEASDENNALRARFGLAELARIEGRRAEARRLYEACLPVATRLSVKELSWQIHRGLGRLDQDAGELDAAVKQLKQAVRISQSITGRAAPTVIGPQRYEAFDDLMLLYLKRGQAEAALEVANAARSFELLDLLGDSRLRYSRPEVQEILTALRLSEGEEGPLLMRLAALEPALAEKLSPFDLAAAKASLPEDGGLLIYRVSSEALVAFLVSRAGVKAVAAELPRVRLAAEVEGYGQAMVARAELGGRPAQLSRWLLKPLEAALKPVRKLAIVPHDVLSYVPFTALPFGRRAVLDRFLTVFATTPQGAVDALLHPLGPIAQLPKVAFGAAEGEGAPLPYADREVRLIAEEYPGSELYLGAEVTREAFLAAYPKAQGVLHFAGHTQLLPDQASLASDPLGGQLVFDDGGVTMLDLLAQRGQAQLVVLSACSSLMGRDLAGEGSGAEFLSMLQSVQLSGAGYVLASRLRVHDLSAALLMKHFYRAARRRPAAEALREAQRAVRQSYPHPAWWASFGLVAGPRP